MPEKTDKPSLSFSSRRPALPSLTGSRIIAAFGVFLFHASLVKMLNPYADPATSETFSFLVGKAGWLGVSYFFVLSGFIMVWSAKEGDTPFAYYRRRIAKIFPTHVVTWALAVFIGTVSLSRADIWLPNLFLINSWFPDIDIFVSVNQPSWSLCIEMFFYLLFPVLFGALIRIPSSYLSLAAVACVASLALVQIMIAAHIDPEPTLAEWPLSETQWWLSYNFPPLRMFEFAAGMIIARIVVEGRWRGPSISSSCVFLGFAYTVALYVPFQFGLNLATLVPIMLLIPAIALADVDGRTTVLSSKPMVWLGEISFGFYMIHFLVLLCIKRLLAEHSFGFVGGTAVILVGLTISIAGGWTLYRCVELPMVRYLVT